MRCKRVIRVIKSCPLLRHGCNRRPPHWQQRRHCSVSNTANAPTSCFQKSRGEDHWKRKSTFSHNDEVISNHKLCAIKRSVAVCVRQLPGVSKKESETNQSLTRSAAARPVAKKKGRTSSPRASDKMRQSHQREDLCGRSPSQRKGLSISTRQQKKVLETVRSDPLRTLDCFGCNWLTKAIN